MLDKHLIVQTRPIANEKNVVLWGDYRITVLQDRLFRLEQNARKNFRDDATQSVWFRDMPPQNFRVEQQKGGIAIVTPACTLIVKKNRADCRILLGDKRLKIDNSGNLKGTYRTLDGYDGDTFVGIKNQRKKDQPKSAKIPLGDGVCSKTGVALFHDENSLTLGIDGEVKPQRGEGSDEYIFAYGNDYRAAVKALYLICGSVPQIPRFALGNWWSRYYIYTDKEYLRLLNLFEEQDVPLTVATIDMDWHYSTQMEADLHITEKGRNTPFYGGNNGWTGYSWNKRLFPDYKSFLKKIEDKNLKITLNLHPADGVRWWEDCYENMANALGRDAASGEWIKFDIASTDFVNAYFSQIHKPYEEDGVAFWWIDWQQGVNSGMEGLDPLWSLNHYHYLDNGANHPTALILSRYCGVGSHRYPLGFSGDTHITWETLDYLPEFTATASNVGYTWWSHDIGGHMYGEKGNELYLRHVQYGVFSPINRLHCCNAEVCTKEPWAYGNGTGEIAKNWLRLRHKLIPYLYTASHITHTDGVALVEPLYNVWNEPEAYAYKNEYLFGSQLLVAPVTQAAKKDGFARVKAWLPEGRWTDIFTGGTYIAPKGGKKVTLLREMESIPVFIKSGGVLPLSADKGNSVDNPTAMEINVYTGNGKYELYEDGATKNTAGELITRFVNSGSAEGENGKQTLTISTEGDSSVVPQTRLFKIRFKDVAYGEIAVYEDGKKLDLEEVLLSCAAVDVPVQAGKSYVVELCYKTQTRVQELIAFARKTLLLATGGTIAKDTLWEKIKLVTSVEQYAEIIDADGGVSSVVKACLKEIL